MADEWDYAVIDVSTATTQSVAGATAPCLLNRIEVLTALSAHTVDIADDGTSVYQIPASSAVGYEKRFGPTRFLTDLEMLCNAAGTGKIAVEFRRLDQD